MTRRRAFWLAASSFAFTAGCNRPQPAPPPASTGSDRPADGLGLDAELQLDYALIFEDSGSERRGTEKQRVRAGDRFRLQIKPAFPAHVYLLNRGTSQANYSFLYPHPKIERENPMEAGRAVTLPGGADWYTLDKAPGVENLVLVASPAPLVEFHTPERSIVRDEFESRLALVERDYRPASFRRFEDKDWVKLFAARGPKTAIVLRLPLDHR